MSSPGPTLHMSTGRRIVAKSVIALMLAIPAVAQDTTVAKPLAAQDTSNGPVQFETRAELEAQQKDAEAQHRTSEAWLLRNRLQNGDFQEGDRIVLVLHGSPSAADTLIVRAGRVLQLPRMADLQLQGVLRSELNAKVTAHLAEYLKDPTSRATPLLRLGVLGHVGRPGYYYTPADVLLSDAIMRAGGPGPDADLTKIEIRRGPDVIWSPSDARTALTDGLSLDRLHLRAGDEINVGARTARPWATVLQVSLALLTLGLAFARYR